jgi:hypothetical protein
MIHQPLMAVERLFGSGNFAKGPDYPGNADDMRTLLFSMYGGNALKPVRAAETIAPQLLSDTGKPSLMGGAVAGAEGNTSLRGYRGGIKPEYVFPPAEHDAFWGSSAPEVANTYAGLRPSGDIDNIIASRIEKAGGRQSVAPADFNFSNPMIVDAVGSRWDRIPFEDNNFKYSTTSDNLARIARERGHDGLILNNILDSAFAFGDHTPGNTYVALKRGTVTSPLTGETLFSDTGKPSLFGSASYQNQDPQNSYASGGNVADTSGLSGLTGLRLWTNDADNDGGISEWVHLKSRT